MGVVLISLKTMTTYTLRQKCPYSELFWSAFSRIQSECGKIWTRVTPNTDTFYALIKCDKRYKKHKEEY